MTTSGRPLRAFRLLALALGMLVMWRLPMLTNEYKATRLALMTSPGLALADAGFGGSVALVQPVSSRDAILVSWRDFGAGGPVLADYRLGPQLLIVPYPAATLPAAPETASAPAIGLDVAGGWSLPPAAGPTAPTETAAASPPAPPAAPTAGPTAGDYATAAYAELAKGNRRAAAGFFDLALAAGPDPRDAEWKAQRRQLTKRWSGEVFSLLRDPGTQGTIGPAAAPVLGGGQSGASLAYTFNPLARRPIALSARLNSATGGGNGTDPASTQAAVGVRWQVVPAVSLYAERLIAIGAEARNDWQLRAAGGGNGQRGRLRWNAYGEAGIIAGGNVFAGAQGFGGVPIIRIKGSPFMAGAGAWGSYQTGTPDASALDLGPSVATRLPLGRWSLDMSADYRFRLAGNALPGSGPALTIATQF